MAEIGAIAGLISAGVGAASAAGVFNPDAPDPLNYAQITRDAQAAQLENYPKWMAAKQQYDPMTAALQMQIQQQNLFGAPGGTRERKVTEYVTTPARQVTVNAGQSPPPGAVFVKNIGGGIGPSGKAKAALYEIPASSTPVEKTITEDVAATPGQLDLMEQAAPRLTKLGTDVNTALRTSDVADVANLGPAAFKAMQGYDPMSATLSDTLASQAQSDLELGGTLNPSETRETQQAVRAAQAARGFGFGPTDVYTETLNLGNAAAQRKTQRQAAASSILGQRAQIYGDPFQQILSRTSGRAASMPYTAPTESLVQAGTDPYAMTLAQFNAQNANAANIAGYNQQMSGIGALLKGLGSVGSYFNSTSGG